MSDARTLSLFLLLIAIVGIATAVTVTVCEYQRAAAKEVSR